MSQTASNTNKTMHIIRALANIKQCAEYAIKVKLTHQVPVLFTFGLSVYGSAYGVDQVLGQHHMQNHKHLGHMPVALLGTVLITNMF